MYQIRYGDTHHLFRQTIKPCRYQGLVIFSLDDMGHTDALEIDASMKDASNDALHTASDSESEKKVMILDPIMADQSFVTHLTVGGG